MKTIGLLGGMSWESTESYYRLINEAVRARMGGLNSAKLLSLSVNFAEIYVYQSKEEWEMCGALLNEEAKTLARAGVDAIAITTNTMHKVAGRIMQDVEVPLLHIAEATADALLLAGVKRVALLGTMTTMKEPFYKEVLLQKGLAVYVPSEKDGLEIDRIIFHELCQGEVVEASRQRGYKIIGALKARGAEAVILGCTELDLLLSDEASALPLFDTTRIHAEAIANYMMSD